MVRKLTERPDLQELVRDLTFGFKDIVELDPDYVAERIYEQDCSHHLASYNPNRKISKEYIDFNPEKLDDAIEKCGKETPVFVFAHELSHMAHFHLKYNQFQKAKTSPRAQRAQAAKDWKYMLTLWPLDLRTIYTELYADLAASYALRQIEKTATKAGRMAQAELYKTALEAHTVQIELFSVKDVDELDRHWQIYYRSRRYSAPIARSYANGKIDDSEMKTIVDGVAGAGDYIEAALYLQNYQEHKKIG